MIRLSPLVVLALVTALMLGYGPYTWSWLAGPLAALATWSLGRRAQEPGHLRRAAPAPVD